MEVESGAIALAMACYGVLWLWLRAAGRHGTGTVGCCGLGQLWVVCGGGLIVVAA